MGDSLWLRRRNPLLGVIIKKLSSHYSACSMIDGDYIFLPGSAGGVPKIQTYRGGVLIAEKEYLPAERRAAQVEQETAICPDGELHCGIVCRWSKIIRRWINRRLN